MTQSKTLAAAFSLNLGTDKKVILGHLDCHFESAILATLDLLCTPEQIVRMPQKGIIKTIRHCKFIASDGLYRGRPGKGNPNGYILDSGIGFAALTVALTSQNRIVYSDLRALMGGSQENATQVNGVSRARLHKFLPMIVKRAAGTLSAQSSRTIGSGKKDGIFNALGITEKCDGHSFSVVNRNHPMILATCDVLNRLSETTLVEMLGQDAE